MRVTHTETELAIFCYACLWRGSCTPYFDELGFDFDQSYHIDENEHIGDLSTKDIRPDYFFDGSTHERGVNWLSLIEKQDACEQSFLTVIQAPMGSGKTEELMK